MKWNLKVIGEQQAILLLFLIGLASCTMSPKERVELREEARDMFYHAYDAYMERAFPADELMPLSCKGRFRGLQPSRGDIDDVLGNYSVTLVDSLDTLFILGDLDEFERGVKLTLEHVSFDHDIIVSSFETNIRIVGGLLSAHVLAEYSHDRLGRMKWYQGELLDLALDIGYRLLPAFNSTTGLPHPRVNLRHGIKAGKINYIGETCTACAGSMILEFAALSRLSGEPIFEEKAARAMDVLWASRHRQSNLVGNVLNINTGEWVRRDSGVGAGIDSYYEYLAKAYILLGDEKYLARWDTHYQAVMKYLGQRPLFQDVHMHRPHSTSKPFIDSLGAFWPGLQVLMGDIKPAIEFHELLYQVMQRHNFIPEAFTLDYQVHWGHHFLRPEFVESTYFLFKATGDPYYLQVGKNVLKSLQKHARVPCGYATIKDVRTLQLEDRMDSFVLSETFKYLYLLFAEDEDLPLDLNQFVFTTEAHLLPLTLARLSNRTAVPVKDNADEILDEDVEYAKSCPSTDFLFPANKSFATIAQSIRTPLANTVNDKCPVRTNIKRKLYASEFSITNPQHIELIKKMGISIISLADGRSQLIHSLNTAASREDGEEGLLFMQEMIDFHNNAPSEAPEIMAKFVHFLSQDKNGKEVTYNLVASPAQFGKLVEDGFELTSAVIVAEPKTACTKPENGDSFWGKIAVVERGGCMFVEKARVLEGLGAKGAIVIDNAKDSSAGTSPLFAMSGDGTDDLSIPVVFLFTREGKMLLDAIENNPNLVVTILEVTDDNLDGGSATNGETFSMFDIAAPVKSLIEKSKKYFSFKSEESTKHENEEEETEMLTEDEEEDGSSGVSDTISVSTSSDGSTTATRTQIVRGPDGKIEKRTQVETYVEKEDGTIEVRTVSEEKVETENDEEVGTDHEETASMTQVINTAKEVDVHGAVNWERLKNVLRDLDTGNPKVARIFKTHVISQQNGDRFLQTPTKDLVKLYVQSLWEDSSASLSENFELVVILISELEAVVNRVDQHVHEFVEGCVDRVRSAFDDAKLNQQWASSNRDSSNEDKFESFFSSLNVDKDKTNLREDLLVYPVLFSVMDSLKDQVADARTSSVVNKDEL